ncbi:MAG: (2Fe-2S)-binding protein [Candidatus Cloacimonetes bacterium]|nr:(2Fe-2S)-binding protein [Candidatus Cloacimonadota bacterium]
MPKINIKLNDEFRTVFVEPNEILLDVLREKLGVKSPKCGCDRGDCGACAVLLNGKSVRSCLVLAIEVENQEIVTVEGISKDGLSHVQEVMIDKNAFQCGFCAPGMIISTTELINKNPHPNLEEIKEALSGNLCRCTGYSPILEAVQEATKK